MDKIKIIREALEFIQSLAQEAMEAGAPMQNAILLHCKVILAYITELETSMQSVSERSVDIPIEQPTANEGIEKPNNGLQQPKEIGDKELNGGNSEPQYLINEELIKEIEEEINIHDNELWEDVEDKNSAHMNAIVLLEKCKTALSQVKPSWQPIETAPKDGTYIMYPYVAYQSDGSSYNQVGTCLWIEHINSWYKLQGGYGHKIPQPTHWQPLPPCPEADLIKTIGE